MKISVNWMKQYGGQGLDVPVDELVQRIGSQLGEVDGVENIGEKYQGVVVAKVIGCEDHPNADRLHVCTIDDGGITPDVKRDGNGHVQVVCGAPNVREGLIVAWLPPGTTVPESVGKDPFVLEARELRGVVSNGMLASPKELALGDSHEGILEIDEPTAKPGDDFAKVYGLDDYIIEIENKMFTHRPDCFGQLGVAREIAGISGQKFTSPDIYLQPKTTGQIANESKGLKLEVRNEVPELVPRIILEVFENVEVKPSPIWMQTYLQRVGVRPINNVVDITNYYMLLTGQPTHAYDYDKVKAQDPGAEHATIVVRHPQTNEKLILLGGKTIEPRQESVVIASATKPIGLGGVMGGQDTEVDENTKNIILEVASFDMYNIRRTSMAHGLFTDAVTRFNKGQSPLQNDRVEAMIRGELIHQTGAIPADTIHDLNQLEGREWVHEPVKVSAEFINARLGSALSADDMKTLLENVECTVAVDGDALTITAPFWRTDIETPEDVVEEVGRLYGFDKLPLVLPERSITPVAKNELLELKQAIRENLAKAGANEVLTYSFVHGNLLDKVGQDKTKAYSLSNALSPDLQYFRTSLTPSLLDKVHPNIKAGFGSFALFELGKVHYVGEMDPNEPEIPNEDNMVGLVLAYEAKQQPAGAAYYQAQQYFGRLVDVQSVTLVTLSEFDLSTDEWGRQLTAPYEPHRAAVIVKDNQIWGVIGEFKASVRRSLKLPNFAAGFEVHTDLVNFAIRDYAPLSRFPTVWQDVTLKVKAEQSFAGLRRVVDVALGANAPDDTHIQLEDIGIYQSKDDAAHKNVTFRVHVTGLNRTLTDKEVAKTVAAIAGAAKEGLGAEQV